VLTAFPVPGKDKSRRLCEAFVAGAPREAEGVVFAGVKDSNATSWQYFTGFTPRKPRPWFYIDNSYFDATRGQRFRVTRNRLQVAPRAWTSDGKRFEALGLDIKPWRWEPWRRNWQPRDGAFLFVEQSDLHMRLLALDPGWLQASERLMRGTEVPVIWRAWNRNKAQALQSLGDALAGAAMCVTHTSAAAVQAVLAGVPVMVSHHHALADLKCAEPDERRHFLNVLADHEFTLDELEDGTAWRRLNP
jgi:hypothetical protein